MAVGNKIPVQTFGRVLYVEPNDVSGAINGVPLTPDYTDMCISFNLICEVKSRIQNDIPIGEVRVKTTDKETNKKTAAIYQIFGVTGNGQTESWVSFLQGENYHNTNSLTTYYVDINYDDYLKNNIVEGLGVENITISHESYYTPKVSIKFVDHRGASLFGREEAIHYNDKLTIDNIFGAFFTAPYPEYHLQVKGFYGKPITYRLCCTGFKGSLNPQTGNFEAIATFVGYSYSLLTDIPFEYLVAAPYCKYVGEDYWLAHCDQPEWRMEGAVEGDKVPTLFQLFQRINAAFTDENLLQTISDEEKETVDNGKVEISVLEGIKDGFNTYIDALKNRCENFISDEDKYGVTEIDGDGNLINIYNDENEQLLLMKTDNSDSNWVSLEELQSDITKAIEEFNDAYKEDILSEDILPTNLQLSQINFTDYFLIDKDYNVRINNIKELTVESIMALKINGINPSEVMARKILNIITDKAQPKKLKKYVYLIDLGLLRNVLEFKISQKSTEIDEINRKSERNYLYLAMDKLGIIPYMGNIFKLILCHIETFVQMMKICFININRAKELGQRHPTYLGVNIRNTDFITNDRNDLFLPPWAAVNRKDTGDNEFANMEKNNTFGWVGDFSDYFEEAKLVRALYAACKHISVDPAKVDDEETVRFLYAPIMPSDLNNDENPFDRGEQNLSALGGMLGIRMAQIFGVGESKAVDSELAELLGKVDSLNYYRFIGSKTDLEENILQQSNNLSEALFDIILCKTSADKYCSETDESGNQRHEFEFVYGMFNDIPKRQPVFVRSKVNGYDVLSYTYMVNKNGYGIVPSNTRYTSYYKNNCNEFIGVDGERHYIMMDYMKDKTFLHYCTSEQLFKDYRNPDKYRQYRNTEMYKIVTGTQHVKKILERYREMRGGNIKVLDRNFKIDLSKLLDHYWKVDDKDRFVYMKKTNGILSKPYSECGIEDKMLLGSGFDHSIDINETYKKLNNLPLVNFGNGDVDISNTIVFKNECIINGYFYSLFGVDFYYMQNQIADANVRNHVKALLFLHTLYYDKNQTLVLDKSTITHAVINRIPFGLAALYGAFLWRHKYIVDKGNDPIIYGDENMSNFKPAYIKGGVEYTLYMVDDNDCLRFSPKLSSNYTYPVFGHNKTSDAIFVHDPDYMAVNELINVFEIFIRNQWKTICGLELRKSDGTEFSSGTMFREHINKLFDNMSTAIGSEELETVEFTRSKADALDAASKSFKSFTDNYSFLWYYFSGDNGMDIKDNIKLWLNPSNTTMQNALRSTYLDDCIELRSSCRISSTEAKSEIGKYTDILVNENNVKSYLNGFATQVKEIIDNPNNDVGVTGVDLGVIEDTPEFNRDVALPIYMYLKMLWDKWLVSLDLNDNEFSVANFEKNFVFIDSFYRNIASRFMINCQLLLDCYNSNMSSNLDISVFKFMGDLTTKHNCMFVTVPDFITNWSVEADTDIRTSMETVFLPLPYNSMSKISVNNKFVIMYIPKLSETPSEMNNFRADGFNIWNYNDPMVEKGDSTVRTKNSGLPHILDTVSDVVAEQMTQDVDVTKYSYYVPSFGLAYGRQNNAIFKDIKLSMDAPATTSVVINTLSHTSRMGANNTHRVAFIGQDIYPVFSNYAYLCEFEMMGCAQIQPLMYFQLMNVPMWRGTYIIYSVSHVMTPGNMVTRVKAMKLSNRAVPYSNAWFTENPNFDEKELRKLECLNQLLEGVNVNVVGTVSSDDNNNSENITENSNINAGGHTGGEPILIGDSWAVRMSKYWKGGGHPVGSTGVCDGVAANPSAVAQIKNELKSNPNPKFILLHSGRNGGGGNINKNCYEKFIKACNGNTVYIMQEQYDCHPSACKNGDPHSKNVIDKLNAHIKTLCGNTGGKYKNAFFLDLNANGFHTINSDGTTRMNCCINNGCRCGGSGTGGDGFHMNGTNNRDMLRTALEIIGETAYLK